MPARQANKATFSVYALVLIAIVTAAAVVGGVLLLPLQNVNFNQVNTIDQAGIKTINLSLQADVASVTVETSSSQTLQIVTSVNGSVGVFGSKNPIQVSFNNETVGDTLIVTAKETASPQSFVANSLKVNCNVYLAPSSEVNLNITTETGSIDVSPSGSLTFDSLNLKAATGEVQATMQGNVTIAGDMSLQSTTGATSLQVTQANIEGNRSFNMQTTTGDAELRIFENQTLDGDSKINVVTNTGVVDTTLYIDNTIGAAINSQTQSGQINTNLNGFSGIKSPLESYSYPSSGNLLLNLKTNTGNININASYQTYSGGSIRN